MNQPTHARNKSESSHQAINDVPRAAQGPASTQRRAPAPPRRRPTRDASALRMAAAHTRLTPAASAAFLEKCARTASSTQSRFYYPCNAKDGEPQTCTFALRSRQSTQVIEIVVAECSYSSGGTGWRVWPCALLLACWLCAHMDSRPRRVLEVGCGLGLPALTAAAIMRRPGEATLSDCLPQLLATCRLNVAANRGGTAAAGSARVALLDWDDEAPVEAAETFSTEQGVKAAQLAAVAEGGAAEGGAAERLASDERFDLLLATDVIYSMTHARQLPRVIAGRMARGGELCAMVPVRDEAHTRCFLRGLGESGLCVSVARVDEAWVSRCVAPQRDGPRAEDGPEAEAAEAGLDLRGEGLVPWAAERPLAEGDIYFVVAR